ncbi:MAG: GAF domain-containing protein, partial [Cypionkella sp.]
MQSDIEHIQEIEIASQQGSASRDPLVVQSWLRCLDKHGLDPTTRAEAYILPDAALRQHRQRSEDLIRIARSGIDDLYQLVAGQNYVLLLSDAEGVTVEYLGEDVQKSELRRSGLYLGAEWSEARAGTCALGACIETGEPLIIHQSDHFDVTHGGLSCTAAPIYDTAGSLAAVLDISLLSSPLARTSQLLALNLVRQTARRIEMANIMAESRGDWVLRLAGSPDFLDVDPQAALRLDAGGHVIGMTNGAARLMARALDQDWRKGKGLIGRHVSEVFNLDVET